MDTKVSPLLEVDLPEPRESREKPTVLVNGGSKEQRHKFILDMIAQAISSSGITIYLTPSIEDQRAFDWFTSIKGTINDIIANKRWDDFYIRQLKTFTDLKVAFAINDTSGFESPDHTKTNPETANIIFSTPTALFKQLHTSDNAWLNNVTLVIVNGFDQYDSGAERIHLLEALRILTFRARKPIFAALLVQRLDEMSRDKIASILNIGMILEPKSPEADEGRREFRITLHYNEIRDHLVLPWISTHDKVSRRHCINELNWYAFATPDIEKSITSAFNELEQNGLIRPIAGYILPETDEQRPEYRFPYTATHLGKVMASYCLTLSDSRYIYSLISIFQAKQKSGRYNFFDAILAVSSAPDFKSRLAITRDMELPLYAELSTEESFFVIDHGILLPSILGITPVHLLWAIEAAEIARAVLVDPHWDELRFDHRLEYEQITAIMGEIRHYLSALVDLLALQTVADVEVALSLYQWISEINEVFPSRQPMPFLPHIGILNVAATSGNGIGEAYHLESGTSSEQSTPTLNGSAHHTLLQSANATHNTSNAYNAESGGIMPNFEQAGIDISSGINAFDILLGASPEMLAKLFASLEVGAVVQNALINTCIAESANDKSNGSCVIGDHRAGIFIKHMLRQGY